MVRLERFWRRKKKGGFRRYTRHCANQPSPTPWRNVEFPQRQKNNIVARLGIGGASLETEKGVSLHPKVGWYYPDRVSLST